MTSNPVAVLRRVFGFPGFRPGQEDLVRAVVAGRDALGVLPTGGGKSVCYQVPAVMLPGVTLVITPLVSLMEDQVSRARTAGLTAACLSGTQGAEERREVMEAVRRRVVRLLFVSPERLDVASFADLLGNVRVDLIAVDEAHCISEWGHDFRPAYRRIARLRNGTVCPILALTASATPEVRLDIVSNLRLRSPVTVVRSFDRPNLWWSVRPGRAVSSRLRQIGRAVRLARGVSIVYAPTRRSVETVRDYLASRGHRCDAYHAGLPGPERSAVQERFMRGDVPTVVATNAFGMGIDKADVRAVVHLQLPTTLEAYYQEAGRAGRDGAPSMCVAFHGRRDRRLGRGFIDRTHPSVARLLRLHRVLRAASDDGGIARVDAPTVVRELGALPEAWMSGEPAGPLAALERAGAIVRIRPRSDSTDPLDATARPGQTSRPRDVVGGTGRGRAGFFRVADRHHRVGVRRLADFTLSRRLRRRASSKLRAVQAFARTKGCRRNSLLGYFGEKGAAECGRCDACGWDFESGLPTLDG